MRKFFKRIGVLLSMIFKKSSEGAANATGLAVTPHAKPEIQNVVVKQEEDNYHKQTVGKSYRQLMYEKTIKDNNILEEKDQYLKWDQLPSSVSLNDTVMKRIDWSKKATDNELKEALSELKMSDESYKKFREEIERKTKLQQKKIES